MNKKKKVAKPQEIQKYLGNDKWKKVAKPKKYMDVTKEIKNLWWQIGQILEFTDQLCKSINELNGTKAEPKKAFKRPRAKKGECFFVLDGQGDIRDCTDYYNSSDDMLYAIGNYYLEEKDGIQARNKQLILQELKDLAMELNAGVELDWDNDNQKKWYIMQTKLCRPRNQAPARGLFVQTDGGDHYKKIAGVVYCLSENFLRVARERIGEERLKKLFE